MAANNSDELDWIRKNAIRLCEDADILFSRYRFPSAIFLALASIEESTKFCIHYFEEVTNEKLSFSTRFHRNKFRLLPIFRTKDLLKYLGEKMESSQDDWRDRIEAGEIEVSEEMLHGALNAAKIFCGPIENGKVVVAFFGALMDFAERIKTEFPTFSELINKDPDDILELREIVLYADLDEDRKLKGVPMIFGKDVAEPVVNFSKHCVEFIEEIALPDAESC